MRKIPNLVKVGVIFNVKWNHCCNKMAISLSNTILRSFTDIIDLKIIIQCSFCPTRFKIMFPGSYMDILFESDEERDASVATTSGGASSDSEALSTRFALVFFGKEASNTEVPFLYRGSESHPDKIFTNGFAAHGENPDLFSHLCHNDGNFVSTSTSKEVAKKFPLYKSSGQAFLYEINAIEHGKDVSGVLRDARAKGTMGEGTYKAFSSEKEVAIPKAIKVQDIKGAWLVNINTSISSSCEPGTMMPKIHEVREVEGPFIPNPEYVPSGRTVPVPSRPLMGARGVAHGLSGAALALDGISLYETYKSSKISGDYQSFFREGSRIMGGWSGAAAVGTAFAKTAATLCSPLGPYGPPVCGLVGGAVGSVLGYAAGSKMATAPDSVTNTLLGFSSATASELPQEGPSHSSRATDTTEGFTMLSSTATKPKLETTKTGSVFADTAALLRAAAPMEEPALFPHTETSDHDGGVAGTIAHVTATGLGIVDKSLRAVGGHLPKPLHTIAESAEVVSEVLHNATTNNPIENAVCGGLAGAAKVGVGAAALVGLGVLPEIEVPLVLGLGVMEAEMVGVAAAGGFGVVAQKMVDSVAKPVGDAVKDVCHATFAACGSDRSAESEDLFRHSAAAKTAGFPSATPTLGGRFSEMMHAAVPKTPAVTGTTATPSQYAPSRATVAKPYLGASVSERGAQERRDPTTTGSLGERVVATLNSMVPEAKPKVTGATAVPSEFAPKRHPTQASLGATIAESKKKMVTSLLSLFGSAEAAPLPVPMVSEVARPMAADGVFAKQTPTGVSAKPPCTEAEAVSGKTYLGAGAPSKLPQKSVAPPLVSGDTTLVGKRPVPLFTVVKGMESWGAPSAPEGIQPEISLSLPDSLNKGTTYLYVITEQGELRVQQRYTKDGGLNYHHLLADGRPIRAAGELRFSESLDKWMLSNRTGHYRVQGEQLASQVQAAFAAHGLINTSFTYAYDSEHLSHEKLPDNLTYSTLRGNFGHWWDARTDFSKPPLSAKPSSSERSIFDAHGVTAVPELSSDDANLDTSLEKSEQEFDHLIAELVFAQGLYKGNNAGSNLLREPQMSTATASFFKQTQTGFTSQSSAPYLGPEKSMFSPTAHHQKPRPYRGDDVTARLNIEKGPWVSSEYLNRVEQNMHGYFTREPDHARRIFNRFIPDFAFKSEAEAQGVFAYFEKDAAKAFARLYPEPILASVDEKAFMDHYFSSLLKPGQNDFPQEDFVKALNQSLASSPNYETTRQALHTALPTQIPEVPRVLQGFGGYLESAAGYSQAAQLLSLSGMYNKKTGETANKLFQGATAMAPAAKVMGTGGAIAPLPGALFLAGSLVCLSVFADAFRGSDDEVPGPNPILVALAQQAQQIFELTRICLSMYHDMREQFKFLNEKLDAYHLDDVKHFLKLLTAQEYNHSEVISYIQQHHVALSEQLQKVQSVLPEIKTSLHQLKLQSINQHLEVMEGLRRLDLAPDRRLVSKVRNRLAQHKSIKDTIGEDELQHVTEELQVAATCETKEAHVTHSGLPLSFLEREKMLPWVKDLDAIDRAFVLPMNHVQDSKTGEAVAADYIGFLQEVGIKEGWVDTRCKGKLSQPMLLLDRGLAFIELLQAYKQQSIRAPLSREVMFRLETIMEEIKQLQLFYDLDLDTLLSNLYYAIKQDSEAFIAEANVLEKAFFKQKIVEAQRKQQEALHQDMLFSEVNAHKKVDFNIPEEWEYFHYHFGFTRYRDTDHKGARLGREYIYNDYIRGGEFESRWKMRTGGYPFFGGNGRYSCFLTALPTYPVEQHGSGVNFLTDEQCSGYYKDKWGSLQSEFITFDEFLEELVVGGGAGFATPAEFKVFVKRLHDLDKPAYIAAEKERYRDTHTRTNQTLTTARAEYLKEPVVTSTITSTLFGKPLPCRLAKPRATSKHLISQGLPIDIERLSLHPSIRRLENMGIGRVVVEYDADSTAKDKWQQNITVTIHSHFVYNDPLKPSITLCEPVSISKELSAVYSLDEAVFHLWHTGEYIEGNIRRDLSGMMVTNTHPIPEFATKHPLLLNGMAITLNKDLRAEVDFYEMQWQKELRETLISSFHKPSEPMRHYFKRLEMNVTCLKAFVYLFQHNHPFLKAFVEQPELALFQEEGLLNYLAEEGRLELDGHYNALFYDVIDAKITKLTIPEKLYCPRLEELLAYCQYFHGIATSDHFMQSILQAREKGLLQAETLLQAVGKKQEEAEAGFVAVEERQETDKEALQNILQRCKLLVATGAFSGEALEVLIGAFEAIGFEVGEDEEVIKPDQGVVDDEALQRLQYVTMELVDELPVPVVVDDSDSTDSEVSEEPSYWEALQPGAPCRFSLSPKVELSDEQIPLFLERLAAAGFIAEAGEGGVLSITVAKAAPDELVHEPAFRPQGLFPFLIQRWTDEASIEAIETKIETHLKEKFNSARTLVNEVEPKTGKTPLHLACELGSMELVKLLLGFDAITTVKDAKGHLCWEYAPAIVQEELRALVETRGAWQAKAKALDFSFNRCLWLIEQAMSYLQVVGDIGVPGVLFVGPTRAGKSTLLNACLGTRYQRVAGKRYVEAMPGDRELAPVGHRSTSETMHPNISLTKDYALIDCPGFDENRGKAETICHGVSFHALQQQLSSIKGILLVCDEHDLAHPYLSLRRSLEHIGRMVTSISDKDLAKNICLVVTKASGESPLEDLREWLEEDFADIDETSDEKDWAVKRLLTAITASEDSILLADVTSAESMDKVRAKIASLEVHPIKNYDFSRPQHELQVFRSFLQQMIEAYQNLLRDKKSLQDGLSRLLSEKLPRDPRSFPIALSVLKEELSHLQAVPEVAESCELEALLQSLEDAEALSAGLDSVRRNTHYLLNTLLGRAEQLAAGSEEDIAQALRIKHTEWTVNQLFFEQAQLIASMLGSLKEKPSLTPSLSFFKPALAKERLTTLPDGNCAFNAIALFLRDCFLSLREDNPHLPHWLEMLQADEGMEDLATIEAARTFFASQTLAQTQKILAPLLRRKVIEWMRAPEHGNQAIMFERMQEVVAFRYENPSERDIPDADTFLVHPFIQHQWMQIAREHPRDIAQQKTALARWWNAEGYERYLEEMSQPARSASDVARWGAAPELDILGKLLGCSVRLSRDNRGHEFLGDLTQEDFECQLVISGAHWSYSREVGEAASSTAGVAFR